MKKPYKDKITNIIESCDGKINQLDYMIDGRKPANTQEAKRFVREIKKGLQTVQELVDIS